MGHKTYKTQAEVIKELLSVKPMTYSMLHAETGIKIGGIKWYIHNFKKLNIVEIAFTGSCPVTNEMSVQFFKIKQ